ncbi:MAG: hypothetical protein JXX29_03135 [Deltaproteobacteria bacterium]|nr:hypothetical protein [Deltaproteobacteria bacterium]MBN2670635.1 hypothetical protein [Deltaproteobacteria bacterium]
MNFSMVVPVIESALADGTPVEALEQVRDIFETILAASEKAGAIPRIATLADHHQTMVAELFHRNRIDDDVTFSSLLGCADTLLTQGADDSADAVRRIFLILLAALK